jgi:hypothetical protein
MEPDEQNFVDKGQLDGAKQGEKVVVRAGCTLGYYRNMIKNGKPVFGVNNDVWGRWNEWKKKPTSN